MSKPSMKPLRWMICGVLLGGASLAWPCAGEVCRRDPQLASIDGGVPSNFPLLLTDLWDATRYPNSGGAQLNQVNGGPVVTQARFVDLSTVQVETAPLVEGERYWLERLSGCFGAFDDDGGTFTNSFVVLPAMPLLTQGVTIELADAGYGPVNQYSGASCAEGVPSTYATFRFDISPAAGAVLPFYSWELELEPLDGGRAVFWHGERTGGLLADGSLRREWGYLPSRLTTVFHTCDGFDGGFPVYAGAQAGTYRARLSALMLGRETGLVSLSEPFTLDECDQSPVGPAARGVPTANDMLGHGVARGCSCSATPGELCLLLTVLGFVRRRGLR